MLEAAYLAEDDPIRQSGFSGGSERWRAEREPILEAIGTNGDLLDVGWRTVFFWGASFSGLVNVVSS